MESGSTTRKVMVVASNDVLYCTTDPQGRTRLEYASHREQLGELARTNQNGPLTY